MNDSVVKSVGRVFEVLELFDAERIALSATAIARTLKYPASSTVALLKSMVQLGYLAYDNADRTYFPSARLPLICSWLEHGLFVDGHLFDLMGEINASTEESTYLSWQSDLEMQCVRAQGASQEVTQGVKDRARTPLFSSVAGLLALSQKRDVEIVKLVERTNQQRRKNDPQVDLAAAMEQIRRFRLAGYAFAPDATAPGLGGMAWILRQKASTRILVVSIIAPIDRLKAKERAVAQSVRTILQRAGAP